MLGYLDGEEEGDEVVGSIQGVVGFCFVVSNVLGEFGEVFPVHILDESGQVS
mgnify:CR=1 FL=1